MARLAFLYPPGQNPGMVEYPPDKYNPHQWAVQQALSRASYGFTYGFARTLMPRPGSSIDGEDFHKWQNKALDGWKNENNSRGRGVGVSTGLLITRAVVKEDLTDDQWLWLYQQIRAAPPVKVVGYYG